MRPALLLCVLLAACAGLPLGEAGPGTVQPPLALPAGARTEEVRFASGAATLRARLYLPAEPSGPAIVALHGCSGIGGADTPIRLGPRERDWAARLTALGHPVLFPDSFGSRGLGEACGVRGFPAGPFGTRRDDALAAASWARAQPWGGDKAPILLGWSHGGSTTLAAWSAAPAGAIAGAIAFYPGCAGAPARGDTPLLMLLGGDDDWTPPQPCEALVAGRPQVTRVTYAGAGHAFDGLGNRLVARTLPNGRTVHFGGEPAARDAARGRVAAFLAELSGRAP